VEIPDGLKRKLLEEEEPEKKDEATHASSLKSYQSEKASLISEFEEGDLMKEVRKMYDETKFKTPSYDLRVVDGKYTVTNYSYDYSTEVDGDEEARHKHTKPVYDTVATASFAANWIRKCRYFIKTGKSAKRTTEKVLLDGVNLKFDSGKLYLVLGAPGAGKSTLLRYIADTLRKDKDHVREGSVSLNGISSDDPSTYWSVSMHEPVDTCYV
jgi:ABC-type multidrug transport system fused ATPase/permease subunit